MPATLFLIVKPVFYFFIIAIIPRIGLPFAIITIPRASDSPKIPPLLITAQRIGQSTAVVSIILYDGLDISFLPSIPLATMRLVTIYCTRIRREYFFISRQELSIVNSPRLGSHDGGIL